MVRRIEELETRVDKNEEKIQTAIFTSADFQPALRDAIWHLATSKRTLIFLGALVSLAAFINQLMDALTKAVQ